MWVEWLQDIEKRAESIKPGVWTRKTVNTWRNHVPSDMAKLIAAVRVAEKALKFYTDEVSYEWPETGDYQVEDPFVMHDNGQVASTALAQLQSGEFPKEDA